MSGFKDPSPLTSLSASVETATLAAHGKALLSAGQFDKALDAFQQVITLDPSHRAAHLSVAALKSKKGDKLGAQAFLRDFYARVPLGPPPPVDLSSVKVAAASIRQSCAAGTSQPSTYCPIRRLPNAP
jgi:tetratricopeptide (TPR) repeat protein